MPSTTFNDALETVGQLPPDEQAELIKIVRRRLAYAGRQRVLRDVREGVAEYERGEAKRTTVDELIRETGL